MAEHGGDDRGQMGKENLRNRKKAPSEQEVDELWTSEALGMSTPSALQKSVVKRFYAQKVLYSESPMFRRSYVQKVLYLEGSMFRRSYV